MNNRMKRFEDYRNKLYQDFLSYVKKNNIKEEGKILFELILDSMSKEQWEDEFDNMNKYNIEDNSDFDSDNEVDPLDYLITKSPSKTQNRGVTAENFLKKRKINISIIGRTNVGKSSIINTLLKENRVIVSEVSGTTRDVVPIEWVYKGRRVLLVDTAGLRAKNKFYNKIDKLISAATIRSIKFCHVVIYVIDSMEAFTDLDLVRLYLLFNRELLITSVKKEEQSYLFRISGILLITVTKLKQRNGSKISLEMDRCIIKHLKLYFVQRKLYLRSMR